MKKSAFVAGLVALAAGSAVSAMPQLQFDVNSFSTQAKNASGSSSPFGGVNHTGAIQFSKGTGVLAGIFRRNVVGGAAVNQNFSGSMSAFSGVINMVNGQVTGGNLRIDLSNGDWYTASIVANSGAVSNFVGGGFIVQALTGGGRFKDASFGNVDVSPWFNTQGAAGLPGSFLQFSFRPNSQGCATSDMDIYVDVVPLPPAAWAGLATLGGMIGYRRLRRA